jgi:hypothetical protein
MEIKGTNEDMVKLQLWVTASRSFHKLLITN